MELEASLLKSLMARANAAARQLGEMRVPQVGSSQHQLGITTLAACGVHRNSHPPNS